MAQNRSSAPCGPLRAIWFANADAFERARFPGSLAFLGGAEPGQLRFWCPCGCDALRCAPVTVWPVAGGEWHWDGSRSEPSLDQPFALPCGWAGWLRLGYWLAGGDVPPGL